MPLSKNINDITITQIKNNFEIFKMFVNNPKNKINYQQNNFKYFPFKFAPWISFKTYLVIKRYEEDSQIFIEMNSVNINTKDIPLFEKTIKTEKQTLIVEVKNLKKSNTQKVTCIPEKTIEIIQKNPKNLIEIALFPGDASRNIVTSMDILKTNAPTLAQNIIDQNLTTAYELINTQKLIEYLSFILRSDNILKSGDM